MKGKWTFTRIAAISATFIYICLFAFINRTDQWFKYPESSVRSDHDHSNTSKLYNKVLTLIRKNNKIQLSDIFISVKTSGQFEFTRLPFIINTWFQLARNVTWFFTDVESRYQNRTGGHMINTKCPNSHFRFHLCCKMSVEYDYYIKSGAKWFCHFDDDQYVNVPQLVSFLQGYDHRQEWYLGRTSVTHKHYYNKTNKHAEFWFATGAAFCLSQALALKMMPFAGGGRFESLCKELYLPDDMTLGYIIEHQLSRPLTYVNEFHSHLEQMSLLDQAALREHISFGFFRSKLGWNVVRVPGFDEKVDPTRFLSLHCYLFPHFKFCKNKRPKFRRSDLCRNSNSTLCCYFYNFCK